MITAIYRVISGLVNIVIGFFDFVHNTVSLVKGVFSTFAEYMALLPPSLLYFALVILAIAIINRVSDLV